MIFLTISRGQGHIGDGLSEGSLFANPRVDVQELYTRPSFWMSQPNMTKSPERRNKVNTAIAGRMFISLPGEISKASERVKLLAHLLATARVTFEKSAEGILARWHS
jgi:hypothetical protein